MRRYAPFCLQVSHLLDDLSDSAAEDDDDEEDTWTLPVAADSDSVDSVTITVDNPGVKKLPKKGLGFGMGGGGSRWAKKTPAARHRKNQDSLSAVREYHIQQHTPIPITSDRKYC